MKKLISVVVCCRNMGKELRRCLESLCNQNYENRELIVVDDASTDDTSQVALECQTRLGTSLILISNPINLGVAGSRNVGIRNARGDIIAFTDADCTVAPDWLSELARGFSRERVVAVGGRILDDDCSNIWEWSEKGHNYVARAEGFVTYLQGCNMAFDASVLGKYMFNDEIKYGYEEALLCDRLLMGGYGIWYNPRAVVKHKHRAQLSGLLQQKFNRGYSSIWYRKRQKRFPMLKRHFLMLLCLLMSPGCMFSALFGYAIAVMIALVIFGLVRDEYLYGVKRSAEIGAAVPILFGTELAHFWGALCGLFAFGISKGSSKSSQSIADLNTKRSA
jgi:glycosyltransferase involved in cell wall biosynthesis